MAYTLRYSLGNITIEDGSSDTANSSLFFPGKNYTGYGQGVDQNFLSLLENFASSNSSGPADAIPGQLWYNPGENTLSINTSNTDTPVWTPVQVQGSNVVISNTISVARIQAFDPNVSNSITLTGFFSLGGNTANANAARLSGPLYPDNGTAVSNTQVPFMTATGLGGNANFTYTGNANSINYNRLTVSRAFTETATPNVTDLPSGIHSTNLYLDGNANVRGNIIGNGWANITGQLVAGSAQIGSLTIDANGSISGGTLANVAVSRLNLGPVPNRVVITDGAGNVVTSSNLTFDGNVLSFTGTIADIPSIGTGNLSSGTINGNWNVANGNFTINDTLITANISDGGSPGTLTGIWSLEGNSNLSGDWRFVTGNTFIDNTVTANIIAGYDGNGVIDDTAPGNIYGNWTVNGSLALSNTSNLIANLVAPELSPGVSQGYLYGNWTVDASNIANGGFFEIANSTVFVTRTISTYSNIANANLANISGNIFGQWSLANGARLSATYADLAERYSADNTYEAGTVVDIGGTHEITVSLEPASNRVLGVISNTYGYLLNGSAGSDDTHPAVALTGRVTVKAVGIIKKGDRLISAGGGYAKAGTVDEIKSDNVIGRALEDKTTQEVGNIMAVVQINGR